MTTGTSDNEIRSKGENESSFLTVLVDTSLLIELQKRPRYSEPVQKALMRYGFRGASSYSQLEFKRAWLQRLSYLQEVCRKRQVKTVADVHDWVVQKLSAHPANRRQLQTCLQQLIQFLERDGRRISDRAQLLRLERQCKYAVLAGAAALMYHVTHVFSGTGCVRALEKPAEKPGGMLDVRIRDCRPSEIRCRVHLHFQENLHTFQAIARRVRDQVEASEELLAMVEHIGLAQTDPTHLCDNRHCRKLADALIATDGRTMDELAANNDAEWRLLAEIMKRPLVNPVTGQRYDEGHEHR